MIPNKILMCKPEYFDISYAGNDFMKNNINKFNKVDALNQWLELKKIYEKLKFEVHLIEPVDGLPDMVFTANQSFPFKNTEGKNCVLLSKMKNHQRVDEVKYFEKFYKELGYIIYYTPEDIDYFESMGDCIVDYERDIIFGGYGYRTDEKIYDYLKEISGKKIVKIKLQNSMLYHLDTCFSIINRDTIVIDESAFDDDTLKLFKTLYTKIIYAEKEENEKNFVCNNHSPDGKNVIVQRGSEKFKSDAIILGLNIIETDTSEFIKSGGSVFCMKLMFY
ncbi:MAG TPA: arginine deiminase family protein [Ignavibacteria bacterium]|nr:arginine deiminase family protein [Ignavibacteria bacterium]